MSASVEKKTIKVFSGWEALMTTYPDAAGFRWVCGFCGKELPCHPVGQMAHLDNRCGDVRTEPKARSRRCR